MFTMACVGMYIPFILYHVNTSQVVLRELSIFQFMLRKVWNSETRLRPILTIDISTLSFVALAASSYWYLIGLHHVWTLSCQPTSVRLAFLSFFAHFRLFVRSFAFFSSHLVVAMRPTTYFCCLQLYENSSNNQSKIAKIPVIILKQKSTCVRLMSVHDVHSTSPFGTR